MTSPVGFSTSTSSPFAMPSDTASSAFISTKFSDAICCMTGLLASMDIDRNFGL